MGTVSKLMAVFSNGDKVPAHVVAANIGADVALIKVDNYAKLPPPLELADSERLEQGQWAIAIGEPLSLQQTVTVGVVSAFNRAEPIPTENGGEIDFKGLLQTSAPINPGNSGGPLLDIDGRVIGMNQSTVKSAYAQGIGFAIPSNTVKKTIADLLKHPGVHQGTDSGYIGIYMGPLTPGFKNQTGYSGEGGIGIGQVFSGSPADQAGLAPGDVILQADGKPMNDVKALARLHRLQEARRHDPPRSLVARRQEARHHQSRRKARRRRPRPRPTTRPPRPTTRPQPATLTPKATPQS